MNEGLLTHKLATLLQDRNVKYAQVKADTEALQAKLSSVEGRIRVDIRSVDSSLIPHLQALTDEYKLKKGEYVGLKT